MSCGGGTAAAMGPMAAAGPYAAIGGGLLGAIGDYRGEARRQRGLDSAIAYMDRPSYLELDEKSARQQALEDASYNQYMQQQSMVDNMMSQLPQRQALAGQAQGSIGGFLSGQGFDPTQSEMQRIEAMRQADIAASQNAVQQMLDQNMAGLNVDMARRGVRGQAASQLQAGALGTAADQLNRATLEANRGAAANYLSIPQQRASMQANMAGQFADFGDALQQRAFMNRGMLQNPALMSQLQNERMATGRQMGPQAGVGQLMMDRAGIDRESAFMGGLLPGARGGIGAGRAYGVMMNPQAYAGLSGRR